MNVYYEDIDKELVAVLQKSVYGGSVELREVREYFETAGEAQYQALVLALARLVAESSLSPDLLMQAALQLKNMLYSNEAEQRATKSERWMLLGAETREAVKIKCFSALGTQQQGFNSASICIAYIACVEIPLNQWPNIIIMLVENITKAESTESLKQASLEALRNICNEIHPNIPTSFFEEIFESIVPDLKYAGDDENEWNVHKASARYCLSLLAQVCGERIVQLVMPYVQDNINHVDWRLRDAAVMAFSIVLQGTPRESLEPPVHQTMTGLINLITDVSPLVRISAAQTIRHVCEILPEEQLNDDNLPSLLQATAIKPGGTLDNADTPDLVSTELRIAGEYLDRVAQAEYDDSVLSASGIIAMSSAPPSFILTSWLLLKRAAKSKRWLSLSAEKRQEVKMSCFSAMGYQQIGFHSASLCVAYIACVEIPLYQWPDIIRMLVENITKTEATESLKLTSLAALGYIVKKIDMNLIADQLGKTLAGTVCDLKKEERNTAEDLLISLEFTQYNLSQNERDHIMDVVYKSIDYPDIEVAVTGLKCLVKMVDRYYSLMEQYMTSDLFHFIFDTMKYQKDTIVIQCIKFWSTVCREEWMLANSGNQILSKNYASCAVEFLVPILLHIFMRQEEGNNEDKWKAAGVCLELLYATCKETSKALLVPVNINKADWRQMDAAIVAFERLTDDPPIVTMPMIINLLMNVKPVFQDIAARSIRHISAELPELPLNYDSLPSLVDAILGALTSDAKVAANVCWALCSLSKRAHYVSFLNDVMINGYKEPQTYILSPYFVNLVEQLFATTDRQDSGQTKLRNAAYSALMELTKSAPRDCYECIQRTTRILLGKVESFLEAQSGGLDIMKENQLAKFQSLLCETLQGVFGMGTQEDVLNIADIVMAVLTPMLLKAEKSEQVSRVQEDALLVVSDLINSIGTDFNKYLQGFMEVLIPCLTNVNEHQICANAIEIIGDLTRNMLLNNEQYLSTVFENMNSILRNPGTQRSLVPLIITTYGDFAQYLSDAFTPHRSQVLETLKQICQTEVDLNNPVMVDYINCLRRSCIDAFVGLIQGGRGEAMNENVERPSFIIPHIDFIVKFVEDIGTQTITSARLLGSCCGLVRDIITAFGKESLDHIDTDGIEHLLIKSAPTNYQAFLALEELRSLKE